MAMMDVKMYYALRAADIPEDRALIAATLLTTALTTDVSVAALRDGVQQTVKLLDQITCLTRLCLIATLMVTFMVFVMR
ncbi:hypothetical protein [Nitrospirillum pindoramense]|uniref:Uncharacterized protein n=1 Tax=Nitrospirillum amazonense TaxID=28077 RepID=A0A560GH16_9PROT|nr:hypothetical protein [Nitrospirillum amazonense]TWB33263.1 hypothetical protein FBZ90_1355 [Nitrospirillum amazonense]